MADLRRWVPLHTGPLAHPCELKEGKKGGARRRPARYRFLPDAGSRISFAPPTVSLI